MDLKRKNKYIKNCPKCNRYPNICLGRTGFVHHYIECDRYCGTQKIGFSTLRSKSIIILQVLTQWNINDGR